MCVICAAIRSFTCTAMAFFPWRCRFRSCIPFSDTSTGESNHGRLLGVPEESPQCFSTRSDLQRHRSPRHARRSHPSWRTRGTFLGSTSSNPRQSAASNSMNGSRSSISNPAPFPIAQFAVGAIEKILFLLTYPAAMTIEIVVGRIEKLIEKMNAYRDTRAPCGKK